MRIKNNEKTIIVVAIIFSLLAVAFGVFTFYQTRPAQRYRRLITTAEKYLADENFEQALLAFEKAIAIDPKAVEAYIGKASSYEQYAIKISTEDEDKAALLYEKAIETWKTIGNIRDDSAESDKEIARLCMIEGELLKGSDEEWSYEAYQKAYDLYSEMAEDGDDGAKSALDQLKKDLEDKPKKWEIIHHELKSEDGKIDCSYDEVEIDPLSSSELIKAVQEYNEGVAKESNDSYEEYSEYDQIRNSLEYTQVLSMVRYDKKVLSVCNDWYWYSGGSHGDGGESYVNFDTESGKRISIKDVITDIPTLVNIAYSELLVQEEDLTERGVEYNDVDNLFNNEIDYMEDYWCLDESGLGIFFPHYSMTSYSGGTFKILISYDKYPQLFKDDFTLTGPSIKDDSNQNQENPSP